jgi:hypothetical protein
MLSPQLSRNANTQRGSAAALGLTGKKHRHDLSILENRLSRNVLK